MVGEEPIVIGAIIGFIGTIIGVIIGFGLNCVKEWRDRNKQKESVKLLISLEIDKNLEMFTLLWNRIHEDLNEEREDAISRKTFMLIDLPSTHWKDESLNNLISYLPLAFTVDEIENVHDFYDDLEKIESIRLRLRSIYDNMWRNAQSLNAKSDDFIAPIEKQLTLSVFDMKAPDFWNEFEKIALKLLKNGNPFNK